LKQDPKYHLVRTIEERQQWQQISKQIAKTVQFIDEQLIGKEVYAITADEGIKIHIERSNIPHLFGIEYKLGRKQFWRDAKANRVDVNQLFFKNDGTTMAKLRALVSLQDLFTKSSRLVKHGRFEILVIDKGIRTSKQLLALGLIFRGKEQYYVPNTALDLKKKRFDVGKEILVIYTYDVLEKRFCVLQNAPDYEPQLKRF
jgi:hypothetical protein